MNAVSPWWFYFPLHNLKVGPVSGPNSLYLPDINRFLKQFSSVYNNPYIASSTASFFSCYWVSTREAKCGKTTSRIMYISKNGSWRYSLAIPSPCRIILGCLGVDQTWSSSWNIHGWAMLGGASPHFQRPLIVPHPFVTRLAASRSTWARKATGWTKQATKLKPGAQSNFFSMNISNFQGTLDNLPVPCSWTFSHLEWIAFRGRLWISSRIQGSSYGEDSQEQKAIMRTNHSTTRKLMDMVRLEAFQWPGQALHCLEFPIFV